MGCSSGCRDLNTDHDPGSRSQIDHNRRSCPHAGQTGATLCRDPPDASRDTTERTLCKIRAWPRLQTPRRPRRALCPGRDSNPHSPMGEGGFMPVRNRTMRPAGSGTARSVRVACPDRPAWPGSFARIDDRRANPVIFCNLRELRRLPFAAGSFPIGSPWLDATGDSVEAQSNPNV